MDWLRKKLFFPQTSRVVNSDKTPLAKMKTNMYGIDLTVDFFRGIQDQVAMEPQLIVDRSLNDEDY